MLRRQFRYVEMLQEGEESCKVRCYFGSSTYNVSEMSDLINGTVQDAEALGIDTASPEEIEHMISLWKGCKEMNGY